MIRQTLQLARILLDRRVTAVPLRVLGTLQAQGKQRLPAPIQRKLGARLPSPTALAFLRRWLGGERLTRHRGQWVLNSFQPPFPGRAFDRMFENLLSGRRLSPVSAFLAVTRACPYHCWHCSVAGRQGDELTTAHWLKTLRQLHELGASIIGFTGGEPVTRTDLAELVAVAHRGGAATILFTAGAGVDGARITRLRAAGLWALCVSLDSDDPAEHDRLRGAPGAFEHALAALRAARAGGLYTMMAAVATRSFVETRRFERLHRLGARLGVQEFRLVEPMPCGRLGQGAADCLLSSEHVGTLRAFHVTVNRRGRGPKVCAFNQIESPELFGCGAGTQHLYIDPAGEVCPCDFTPLSFGNVRDQPLAAIWERMTTAMGRPRRHCFIQRHHALIARHAEGRTPLPPERSEQVCAAAGTEALPDYFALVTGSASPPERPAQWPNPGGPLEGNRRMSPGVPEDDPTRCSPCPRDCHATRP